MGSRGWKDTSALRLTAYTKPSELNTSTCMFLQIFRGTYIAAFRCKTPSLFKPVFYFDQERDRQKALLIYQQRNLIASVLDSWPQEQSPDFVMPRLQGIVDHLVESWRGGHTAGRGP
jgi:hypothetical protein